MKKNLRLIQTVWVMATCALFLVVSDGCRRNEKEYHEAAKILQEMVNVTRVSIVTLEAKHLSQASEDDRFREIRNIANAHRERITTLGVQLEQAKGKEFFDSEKGRHTRAALDVELARLKALCFELSGTNGAVQFSINQLSLDDARLPDAILFNRFKESEQDTLWAKYGFIRATLLGIRQFDNVQRAESVKDLTVMLAAALKGDPQSKSRLDLSLEEVLRSYPTNDPGAQLNLGILYSGTGQREKAMSWLKQAQTAGLEQAREELRKLTTPESLDRTQRAGNNHPNPLREILLMEDPLIDALVAKGDRNSALRERRAVVHYAKLLASEDGNHLEWQRDLSLSHMKLGTMLAEGGESNEALLELKEGLRIAEMLVGQAPRNSVWRRDVAVCYIKIAEALSFAGDGESNNWLRKGYDAFSTMKESGLFVSPEDEQFVQQLRNVLVR
jgi:tetratricopeptide (TPR) repeat protein